MAARRAREPQIAHGTEHRKQEQALASHYFEGEVDESSGGRSDARGVRRVVDLLVTIGCQEARPYRPTRTANLPFMNKTYLPPPTFP